MKKIAKNCLVIPAVVLSSIIVEAAKKYFSNVASLQDITSTDDPQDLTVQTTAIVLTAGAMVMQLTMISFFVVKSLTGSDSHESEPHEAKNSSSFPLHGDDLEYQILPSVNETKCEKCRNNYCSCTSRCAGNSFSFYLKLICLTNVVPVVIVGGKLGLNAVFANFMKLTPEEFMLDNSSEATLYNRMTWILPLFSSVQFIIYCLLKAAFVNADAVGEGIKNKQCNVRCTILCGTLFVSLPCVIAAGFSNYFFTKTAIPQIYFLRGCPDSVVNTISLTFGIINLPSQAIMVIPFAYKLLHDFFKKETNTVNDSFVKNISPIIIINVSSMLFDAASNLLGMRVSIKCMMRNFHIGEIPNARSINTTSPIVSCPTELWVEGTAYIIASSAALTYLGFNLYQLKQMQKKKNIQLKLPSQSESEPSRFLKSPGRFSMFEEKPLENKLPLLPNEETKFGELIQSKDSTSAAMSQMNSATNLDTAEPYTIDQMLEEDSSDEESNIFAPNIRLQ